MNSLKIDSIKVGDIKTNCYIISFEDKCLLIDPGSDLESDVTAIKNLISNKKIVAILLTHAHFDHIAGCKFFNAPIYINKADEESLKSQADLSLEVVGHSIDIPTNVKYYTPLMELSYFSFSVINTPGHTSGSVCLYFESSLVMFTGDTLFSGTYGRTDVGGNRQKMISSLHLLSKMDDLIKIYPGHGRSSLLGLEKHWMKEVV